MMTRKERFDFVIRWFQEHMPEAETELQYNNPYELLIAVILSAQCTDKRVNMVTPALFLQYPDAFALSRASFEEVHPYIASISFPNNKTKHILKAARMLVDKWNGEVPGTLEELVLLPGVGRKTANVITSVVWQQPHMAVDTHVFRVAARIGLTQGAKNPLQAEEQLVKYLPEDLIYTAHHWLILHGRYICLARRPKCEECGLKPACKFYGQEMQYVVAGQKKMSEVNDDAHKVNTAARAGKK